MIYVLKKNITVILSKDSYTEIILYVSIMVHIKLKYIKLITLLIMLLIIFFILKIVIKPSKKYYFCIICRFKNERHIINEWLDHHISRGVDHFWLIDNGSTDQYKIDPKFKKYVTIYYEPNIGQYDIYNKYLSKIKRETEWISVNDMDEFLYSKKSIDIKEILKNIPSKVSRIDIQMNNFICGSFKNNRSNIESNLLSFPDHKDYPKCISRSNSDLLSLSIHSSKNKFNNKFFIDYKSDLLKINHYRYQSIEYTYGIKEGRGGGVKKDKYKNDFVKDWLNSKTEYEYGPYLKDNSKDIITNCYTRNDPSPKISSYPDSTWVNKYSKINLPMKFFYSKKDLNNMLTKLSTS